MRGNHVKSDYTHTIINTHPLAHIIGTCTLIFSSCGHFSVYPNCILQYHSNCNIIQYHRALHSFLSFKHSCKDLTIIPLLPKAIFTPSIQPNLGLPCTHHPLASTINTFLAIQYSSIFSTGPNHLKTL